MKLKYYLRGMGIGVIITTLILMVAFHLHQNEPLSDDEIRARAEQMGMVMADELPERDKLSDNELPDADEVELDDTEPEDTDLAESKADTPSDEAADVQKDDTAANDTEKNDAAKDDTAAKPAKDVIEQVEISIVGGEYSADVCKKLKRAGLIEDTEDFNRYLSDGGYDSLIQPGNYVIPLGSDYDTIIAMITEKVE